MKKTLLTIAIGVLLTAATLPQFFYYNNTRKAIAIRDTEKGEMVIKDRNGYSVARMEYPANTSRWLSVTRLAPGLYTAQTSTGATINFYKRP